MPPDHKPKPNLQELGLAEHQPGYAGWREQRTNAITCTTGEQVTTGRQPSPQSPRRTPHPELIEVLRSGRAA
jgi:hypothetical protein